MDPEDQTRLWNLAHEEAQREARRALLRRNTALMVVWLLMGLLLLGRLWFLQILHGDEIEREARRRRVRVVRTPAPRATIYDAEGIPLAFSRASYSLSIVGSKARVLSCIPSVARLIKAQPKDLEAKVEKNWTAEFRPVFLAEDLSLSAIATLEEHSAWIPGLLITERPLRYYPQGSLASHLLGYVGEVSDKELQKLAPRGIMPKDIVGKSGVEQIFDAAIRGVDGVRRYQVDASGRLTPSGGLLGTVEPRMGPPLHLTILSRVQKAAEEGLAGRPGAAVALNPRTGAILAMASSPGYSPNSFVPTIDPVAWRKISQGRDFPMLNRAISSAYPCGSVFKIVSSLAGIEKGVIGRVGTVICEGKFKVGNRFFRCFKRDGHGSVGLLEALAKSCDVFFYSLVNTSITSPDRLKLSRDDLEHYARLCGIGELTGCGLTPERKGTFPTPQWKKERVGEGWRGGDNVNLIIGQGYLQVTPIQMALACCVIANGGLRPKPFLLQNSSPLLNQTSLSPRALSLVARGMRLAVTSGTAKAAQLPGIAVAGKTGSAEDPPRKKPHAWFICYAPYENPQIAICVMVEQGGHGGEIAAPIARKMLAAYFKLGASSGGGAVGVTD
jgi:penicillin-binding protein 2